MTDQQADIAMVIRALDPFMGQHGFMREQPASGRGSGGDYAQVVYLRGPQRMIVWRRYDLLSVRYCQGDAELDHALYLSLLGARESKRFPCTGDISTQIAALVTDLRERCGGFLLHGSDEVLRLTADHRKDPARFSGLRGL